jgi:hypothetical protein
MKALPVSINAATEQLIAPERGTACFSNKFLRSLLECCSPAPGEFDRWVPDLSYSKEEKPE